MEGSSGEIAKITPEQKSPEQNTPSVEQKLSFARKDLDNVLNQKSFQPENLVGIFEKDFGADYEADAGVWEGYSIKEHTLMVMNQYEKYFGDKPLPANMDRGL